MKPHFDPELDAPVPLDDEALQADEPTAGLSVGGVRDGYRQRQPDDRQNRGPDETGLLTGDAAGGATDRQFCARHL